MLARFLDVPFVRGGRDMQGADCWGLHRLIVAGMTGAVLPAFDTVAWDERGAVIGRERLAACWREVEADEADGFDLALMNWSGEPVHVGTIVEPGKLIHTRPETGPVLTTFSHPTVRHRLQGFYRYNG